jgi:RNA polymerase sigma factor (sigma-70 family)
MGANKPTGDDSDAFDPSIQAARGQGRQHFLERVEHIRPDLHRYAARMTGTLADGEDVVQDTLARAYYQLSELDSLPPLRPWLFRIAHNLAIDHYRRSTYRHTEPLDDALDVADDSSREPDNALCRRQAVQWALCSFLDLAPAQRACVILKDVLDHSLEEIGTQLDLSVPAVKAALHRGRTALAHSAATASAPPPGRTASPTLLRYTQRFNAHDWDGVRAM